MQVYQTKTFLSSQKTAVILLCFFGFIITSHAAPLLWKFSSPKKVSAIVYDGSNVWCATSGGAFRYTMASGEKKMYANLIDLPDPYLVSVVKDNAGDIWFGSSTGYLSRLHPKTETFTTYNSCAAAGWNITCMQYFKNIIFIGTNYGLSIFSIAKSSMQNVRQFGSFTTSNITDMRCFGDTLALLTQNGIAYTVIADVNNTVFADPSIWNLIPADSVIGILHSNDSIQPSKAFVATQSGATTWKYAFTQDSKALTQNGIALPVIIASPATCVSPLSSGSLAVGTQSSFFYLYDSASSKSRQIQLNGPIDWDITDLAIDKTDTVWYMAADLANGTGVFAGEVWRTLTQSNTPGYGATQSSSLDYPNRVMVTSQNDIWISTGSAGVKWLNRATGQWTSYEDPASPTYTQPSPLAHYGTTSWIIITGTCEDSLGNIWFANLEPNSGNILHVRKPRVSQWRSFSVNDTSNNFVSNRTSVLAANQANHTEFIYLGFTRNNDQTGGGLTILSYDSGSDPVSATTIVHSAACDSMPVTGIAIINDTLAYISSPTAIYQLTNNNITSLKKISKITSTGSFNTIAVNYDGRPLFCKDGDLYTYDAVQDTLYNISNLGVFTANVNAITCNNKTGQYRVSTANGIFLFTKEDAPHTITATAITAYPNPVSRHSLQNGHVLHFAGVQPNTSSNTTASFSGSTSTQTSSTIRIYDMAGSLVAIIADMNTTIFSWNGSNRAGKIVLPGMYFFIATAENGTTCKGKIMVVP